MPSPRVTDLLQHLAHRGGVLQCIRDGVFDSQEIADQVDKSRSTVDRNLRILKDNDYVREHHNRYELTRFGEYALELYEFAEPLGRAEQFIPYLPSETPITLLQDANIRQSGGTVPQRPIEHVEELIRAADQLKIIAPAVIPSLIDALSERIRNDSLTIDIIMSGDVLEELWSTYSEELHSCLESKTCMLWQTDEELSFGLVIADDETVCLGVYDESMRLLGTITNSSVDALDWPLETFHEYRDASDEVFLRGTTSKMDAVTTV
jgi:predicted transcriptional regulator